MSICVLVGTTLVLLQRFVVLLGQKSVSIKKDNIAKVSDNNEDNLDIDPIVLNLVLRYLKRVMFIPKNIEVDNKMMPTGSIYSHENWLDSVKPFGETRFEPGIFNCNKSLVEVL